MIIKKNQYVLFRIYPVCFHHWKKKILIPFQKKRKNSHNGLVHVVNTSKIKQLSKVNFFAILATHLESSSSNHLQNGFPDQCNTDVLSQCDLEF